MAGRSCFFDMAFSFDGSFPIFNSFADFCACLNSFSALLRSFSNRRSFFVTFASRLSSRSCPCSSRASFRASFSCWRRSKVLVRLLFLVLISVDALFCGLIFQDLPETLRPFDETSYDIFTISPAIIVLGSIGIGSESVACSVILKLICDKHVDDKHV